jgi:hypothetical protein
MQDFFVNARSIGVTTPTWSFLILYIFKKK